MNTVPVLFWPQTKRIMQKDLTQYLTTKHKRHITKYKQLKFVHFNHMLRHIKGWESESSPLNSGALSTKPGGVYVYRIQFICCPLSNAIRTGIQKGQVVEKTFIKLPCNFWICTGNCLCGNVAELHDKMQAYVTLNYQNYL